MANYGRAVLNSNWHQVRQAEPKDYDISCAPVRDLLQSTYKHLNTKADLHKTTDSTYKEDFTDSPFNSSDFGKSKSFEDVHGIYCGHPFVVLPHADSAADPDHYLTTHQADYKPFTASQSASSSQANPQACQCYGTGFKQNITPYGETLPPRHCEGGSACQDERGFYWNAALKTNCPYSSTFVVMPDRVRP